MATATSYINAADPRHPGVNNQLLQESPIIADAPASMADNDDMQIVMPAGGDPALPPRSVQIYTHTGGDITSTGAATKDISDGDSLEVLIDEDGNGVFETYSHIVSGVTGGAATPAELAASLNADSSLAGKILAVAGLTANAVTLFPLSARGAVKTGTEINAGAGSFGFTGLGDRAARAYTEGVKALAGGTGWVVTYDAASRTLTIKNETGGAVARVFAVVHP